MSLRVVGLVAVTLLMLSPLTSALGDATVTVVSFATGARFHRDRPAITGDGTSIAFTSSSSDVVVGDANDVSDVFLRDLPSGTVSLVSVSTDGQQADGASFYPHVAGDGRRVVFLSRASNLVPGDVNGEPDIFMHDLDAGSTELVSVGLDGAPAGADFYPPAISADGRFVAYASAAADLVPADTNGGSDIFVRDLDAGSTERVSVSSLGDEATDGHSFQPAISADGRFVTFSSDAAGLVPGDRQTCFFSLTRPPCYQIYLHDRGSGTTELVSLGSDGEPAGYLVPSDSTVSEDGRIVVWDAGAVMTVRDRLLRRTERLQDPTLIPGRYSFAHGPVITPDGRWVVFHARRIFECECWTAFLHDRLTRTTLDLFPRANASTDWLDLSDDGRFLTFSSRASNLIAGDDNGSRDLFLLDRASCSNGASEDGRVARAIHETGESAVGPGGSVVHDASCQTIARTGL